MVTGHQYSFGQVRHWVLLHFAEFFFSVGMLPASAFLLLFGLAFRRGGTRSDAERAFLAVTAATVPLLVIEVAAFASRFSLRVEDRYMFFLAPLLFLAFVLWLDRGVPRPPALTIAAAVVPAALLFALPLASLLNVSILSDTFGLIPLLRLASKVSGGIPEVRQLMLVGGVAAALFFVLWPFKAFPRVVFPSAVAAFLVLSSHVVVTTLHSYSREPQGHRRHPRQRELDRRTDRQRWKRVLPARERRTTPGPRHWALWQNEFWNRSLGAVYNLGAPEPAVPDTPVQLSPTTGVITSTATGRAIRSRYVVTSMNYGIDGRLIGARPPFALYVTDGPLRVAEARSGIYGDGWAGADAAYSRFATTQEAVSPFPSRAACGPARMCRGTSLVQLIPLSGRGAGKALVSRTTTLHSGQTKTFTLKVPNRPFTVTVHTSPTFSPSQFGQPDTRQLSAQVQFTYLQSPSR